MAKTNMNTRGEKNSFLCISELPARKREFNLQSLVFKGLIFNNFEFQFEQNCPIAAVNASHFHSHSALCTRYGQKKQSQNALPYQLSISKINFRRVL